MKCLCQVVLLFLFLAVSSTAALCGESFSRIGLSFGGMHIMGLFFEYEVDQNAIRIQTGYMIHAASVSVAGVHYFDAKSHRLSAGIGFIKHVRNMKFQGANLVSVPVGIDFKTTDRQYFGAELLPALSFNAVDSHKKEYRGLAEYIFPLPSISYKYKL